MKQKKSLVFPLHLTSFKKKQTDASAPRKKRRLKKRYLAAAAATIAGKACTVGGTFDYLSESTITAEASGKVASLNIGEGSAVVSGMVVATLSSTSVQNSVSDSQLSLQDAQLSYQNTLDQLDDYTITAPISGVSEDYAVISKLELEKGRFLSYTDMETRAKTAVVGSYLNRSVYGGRAVGQTIKINGNAYKIIGALAEQDDSTEGSSDDCIYIPYTTASKLSFGAISSYTFATQDASPNSAATNVLDDMLYGVFESDDFYMISDMQEMVDSMEEMTSMMTMVLVGIAGISLLVGGIGIMNIMLVSVTERTREIGIRKSLGAKKRDIMRQFVIEAGTTSALGGLIGIGLGIVVATALGQIIGIQAEPSLSAIGLSFGVSVFIGIFFGFMPANKAAKLNPMDALRHD